MNKDISVFLYLFETGREIGTYGDNEDGDSFKGSSRYWFHRWDYHRHEITYDDIREVCLRFGMETKREVIGIKEVVTIYFNDEDMKKVGIYLKLSEENVNVEVLR